MKIKRDYVIKFVGIFSILTLGVVIGTKVKKCPTIDCPTFENVNKEVKLKKDSLQNETINKINAIDSAATHELDSIWSEYARRYGKN